MKIKRLESFTKPFVSFVKVTLEDNSYGFGQMSTYNADITAQIFHKQVAPWVLGKEWDNFEDIENNVNLVIKNSPAYWDMSKEKTKSQFNLFKKFFGGFTGKGG